MKFSIYRFCLVVALHYSFDKVIPVDNKFYPKKLFENLHVSIFRCIFVYQKKDNNTTTKAMKKDEMEKLIGDLRRELADQREHNRKLREQIESERETFRKSLDDAQAAFEEKQYSEWLKANGKFAERFFEDMVNKHLSVGYFM